MRVIVYSWARPPQGWAHWNRWETIGKKSWLGIASKPAPVDFISYVSLVPSPVVMVPMVAVINPVSPGPVVWGSPIIAIVRIWSRVSIRIIAVPVTRIAVPVTRITKSDSNPPNTDWNLSVRMLHGNQGKSTYHQCNQEKFFHVVFPSLFCCFARVESSC